MAWLRTGLWAMTAVYWLALVVLTHTPRPPSAGIHISDKLAHLAAYALLAGMLYACLWSGRTPRRTAWLTLVVVLVYGAVDELTQPLAGRSCELFDWLANAAGAAMVVGMMGGLRRAVESRRGAG
jgi:VanZ family protein